LADVSSFRNLRQNIHLPSIFVGMIDYFIGVACVNFRSIKSIKLALSTEQFLFAALVAVPASIVSVAVRYVDVRLGGGLLGSILPSDDLYKILSNILGFLLVFHTSQAYNRYMSGITLVLQMMGDYTDVMSLLVAFARTSSAASRADVDKFTKTATALISLLFMYSLAELEESTKEEHSSEDGKIIGKHAYKYEVLDMQGIDDETLRYIIASPCKVETICQMLQTLIGDHHRRGILDTPPPLMTRVFQELGNGVLKFHEALKFRHAPFPFTYSAVMDMLLFIYWCSTPIMIASWTAGFTSCAVSTFIVIFAIFSLNGIAGTLENPFGNDLSDMDGNALCHEFNTKLKALLETLTHPPLRQMDRDFMNPCVSTVFSAVLSQFQDQGILEYSDEVERGTSLIGFLKKSRSSRKSRKRRSSVLPSVGFPSMAQTLRNHSRHQAGLDQHTKPVHMNMQQELPPQPARLVPASPCSHFASPRSCDDALGLQTKLKVAIESRQGATNSEFGNDLHQAGGVAVQGADNTLLQECDTGSNRVHVDVQEF